VRRVEPQSQTAVVPRQVSGAVGGGVKPVARPIRRFVKITGAVPGTFAALIRYVGGGHEAAHRYAPAQSRVRPPVGCRDGPCFIDESRLRYRRRVRDETLFGREIPRLTVEDEMDAVTEPAIERKLRRHRDLHEEVSIHDVDDVD